MDSQLDQNLQKGLRGGISIYFATLITLASGFATSVILIRGLTQKAYGILKLVDSIKLVGIYICSLGLEKTFLRFGAEFVTKKQLSMIKRMLANFCKLRGTALITFGIIFLLFKNPIAKFFNFPETLVTLFPLIIAILFFSSLNGLWGFALTSSRMAHVNNSIIRSMISLFNIIGFIFALSFRLGLWGILAVLLLNQVITAVYFTLINIRWFRKIQKTWPSQSDSKIIREYQNLRKRIFRFATFSFMGVNVNIFKDISVDNFFIVRYLDTTQVALYGLASTIITYIAKFNPPAMLRGVFQPIFVGRYVETNDAKELIRGHFTLIKITLFTMLPLYSLLVLLGKETIGIIYSREYLAAFPALLLLSFFFFFVGLNNAYNPVINALEKNELYFITGIFSIYNLIMDILLIPRYGIQGAAIATGSAGFLQYIFFWAALRWYVKLKTVFPWKALGKIAINTTPMILFCLLAKPYISGIYRLIIVGLTAIILYLIPAYFNNVFDDQEIKLFKRAIIKK